MPKYQRPYSWRPKFELRDLWEDVLRIYLARADGTDADESHFLGTLVIGSGGPPKPLGLTPFVVIDGQQRLVALCLMLAAARDGLLLPALGSPQEKLSKVERDAQILRTQKARDDFTYRYLAHRPGPEVAEVGLDELKELLRVVPGELDLDQFARCINGDVKGQRGRSVTAYRWFRQRLAEGLPRVLITRSDEEEDPSESDETPVEENSDRPFDFQAFTDTVLLGLELVTISDVTPENAYQVFRTINGSGLKLGQVDLLRNAFFMLLPTKADMVYREIWKPMEHRLGSDELELFFHTEILRLGRNVARDQVYRTQLSMLKAIESRETSIQGLLVQVGEHAQTYADLRLIQRDEDTEPSGLLLDSRAVAVLTRLKEWGANPAFPLILECGLRLKSKKLNASEFLEVLHGIEALLVRRYVEKTPPNDLRTAFGQMMRRLTGAADKTTPPAEGEFLAAVLAELRAARMPDDQSIRDACATIPFFRPNKQKEVFFILRRIAELAGGKEYPHIRLGTSSSDYSIEHLLPQGGLTSEWRKDLVLWEQRLDETKRLPPDEIWRTHRDLIGNLTITAYNSELSNKSFEAKRAFVREHLKLPISDSFVGAAIWSAEQIEQRGRLLADRICETWPVPIV